MEYNTMIGDKNNSELKYDMNFYNDAHLIDRSNVRCWSYSGFMKK